MGSLLLGSFDPSPLTHSWPLFERDRRFDLGCLFDVPISDDSASLADHDLLARLGVGDWQCDLADNRLTWSTGVYDLFGLPRDSVVARRESVALYAEPSRAAMERLRSYAIRHRRGFTLDAEITPANGGRRWMRIVAAPLSIGGRAVRLQGFKRDVTSDYL